jgi:1-acyl-sn-glycerol-3-phosphate acyltransferase
MAYINKFKGFIAKKEIQKLPIISSWMRNLKCVFMDRKNIRQAVEAINEGVEILKQGYSTVIFPEGTRSRSDNMGEFKAGSFKLATKSGAPIIPVTIKGSYKLFEANGRMVKPADVEVIVSPPVQTANLSREEVNILPERVKEIIESNL